MTKEEEEDIKQTRKTLARLDSQEENLILILQEVRAELHAIYDAILYVRQ